VSVEYLRPKQDNQEGRIVNSVIFLSRRVIEICGIKLTPEVEKLRRENENLRIENKLLKEQTCQDHLTGLPNIRYLEEHIKPQIEEHIKHQNIPEKRKSGQSLVLGVIDMENLKVINDTMGHDVGDDALNCMANALRGSIRPEDEVGRMGGDEFYALLRINDTGTDEIEDIMLDFNDRLHHQLGVFNNGNTPLFASIGYVQLDGNLSYEEAKKLADERMYQNKRDHKNGPKIEV
jgi:diguanylate cyclase (GGDEF)-like protein